MIYQYEQSWQRNEDNQLYHHGINGQKWGKRNGPPYPLDYDQHSSSEKKKNTKTELNRYEDNNPKKRKSAKEKRQEEIQKYKDAGLSDLDAEEVARLNKRGKTLLIAGAAVLGVGAAYCVIKHVNANSDFTLHAGDEIYRIASSGDDSLHDTFYASTNQYDRMKYKGQYSIQKKVQGLMLGTSADTYEKILTAKKDIKVAGIKSAEKIYNKLRETDPLFRTETEYFKNYKQYNQLGFMDSSIYSDEKINKKFFDALKANGYDGLIDVNDALKSGYDSINPVILFGQKEAPDVNVKSVKKLSGKDIAPAYIGSTIAVLGQQLLTGPYGAMIATGAMLSGAGNIEAGKQYLNDLGVKEESDKDGKKS